ncbi:MAG TPA: cation-transporting P-type ATPase [Thermodesulfobacteriota bacterium]|nr:cation-transporting P-type ATPase [Thermodesulfobacteriota bacterium]
MTAIKDAWKISEDDIASGLGVSPDKGLDGPRAGARLKEYGRNLLVETKPVNALSILLSQFRSLIVLLLVGAAVLSFVFNDWPEGAAIVVVIILNAAIGFFTEIRAVRSMEALYKLVRVEATVLRDGTVSVIQAEELVPGDIVLLEAGDIVPADIRLLEASRVESDESSLTGESFPVRKSTGAITGEAELAERSNMVFMGTALTKGSGRGAVTATGLDTELGKISVLVEKAGHDKTPIEKKLDRLGQRLIWVTLLLASAVIIGGALTGRDLLLMIKTGIALAVAAIPEGLPVVATIALARGMLRMARRNALVNRLGAVETLGATNVICTDKTGTLTENKMTVEAIVTDAVRLEFTGEDGRFLIDGEEAVSITDEAALRVIETGVLCSRARLGGKAPGNGGDVGDPLEIALLRAGARAGIDRDGMLSAYPETGTEAFDTLVNMMATFHKSDGGFRVAVKGAPDAVLACCDRIHTASGVEELTEERKLLWDAKNDELASLGLRVIAHAEKTAADPETRPYKGLTFLGLVCLLDPPRRYIREAVLQCLKAGIKVVMVTGDHPATARNIALAVGLTDRSDEPVIHGRDLKKIEELPGEFKRSVAESLILARVSPEQKLALVAFYQDEGFVVAMTGDGVNDAPALKKADIGIAMGMRGTQVAKEAADIVLKDDSFSTIVHAVEQGRIIFGNIRKFIFYLLSCNVSEIMIVTVASLTPLPLPLLPLQILFLNLVTDIFPALALGMGEGDERVMCLPPRDPKEPLITRRAWLGIAGYGALITACVLGALLISVYGLGFGVKESVSVSFLTLAFAQIFHVFNMRDRGSALLINEVTRNGYVWGAAALCVFLTLAAVFIEAVAHVLGVVNPGREGWILIAVMSLVPLVLGQALKYIPRK